MATFREASRMRRILIIGVIALTAMTGVVVTARNQNTYRRYGAGVSSCGTWLENRRSPNEFVWMANGQWIMGWLSAAGHYGTDLKKTDSAAISAWVDNYCKANPLEDLEKAAISLADALRRCPSSC